MRGYNWTVGNYKQKMFGFWKVQIMVQIDAMQFWPLEWCIMEQGRKSDLTTRQVS